MTKYYYRYLEKLKMTVATGTISINVVPIYGQVLEDFMIRVENITGDDTTGTSQVDIYYTSSPFSIKRFYDNVEGDDLIFPSNDHLSTWKELDFSKLKLYYGDSLTIARTYYAVDGTLYLGVYAKSNIHEIPTIQYNGNTVLDTAHHNKIVGVIK